MADRPVIVQDANSSGNVAMFSIVAIVAIAVLVGLFYWQPWNSSAQRNSTTIITQPNNPAGQAGGANSGSSSGGANSGANSDSSSGGSQGSSSSGR